MFEVVQVIRGRLLHARIHDNNRASITTFARAGFIKSPLSRFSVGMALMVRNAEEGR